MTSHRACEACGAALPEDDRAACAQCGRVACWDCGTANDRSQAFCQRCGVWLVGHESAPTLPAPTLPAPTVPAPTVPAPTVSAPSSALSAAPVVPAWTTKPIGSVPIHLGSTPTGRRRWTAVTLAVLLASAAVGSAAVLELRRPDGPAAALAALEPEAHAASPAATPAAQQPDGSDVPGDVTSATRWPDPPASAGPTVAVEEAAPVDAADTIASGSAPRPADPAPARSRTRWACADSARIADAQARRWVVERVSFRAMDGFERVILHLDLDGPASMAATAFGAPMASSSVRGSGGALSRSAVRQGVGVELSGGIRSGLELRGYRPQGLRMIRDLSLYRAGPTSRLLIGLASEACFRMKAPAWQEGTSGAGATAQLIIDVRA